MLRRPVRLLVIGFVALVVLLLAATGAAELYTEALWFGALDRSEVLWTQLGAAIGVRLAASALGGALVLANLWFVVRHLGPIHLRRRYGNLEIAEQIPRRYVHAATIAIAVLTGWWLSGLPFGGAASLEVLAWMRREPFGIADPLFGRDLSFFVFALPVYIRTIDYLMIAALWSVLLVAIGYVLVGALRLRGARVEIDEHPRVHFALVVALLLLLLAARYWLGRYGLLIEGSGFQQGTGYTDIHARLPAHRVLALLSAAAAGALVYGALRRTWWPPAVALGVLFVALIGLGTIYPAVIQQLRVEPNELQRESLYITWRMQFTRLGFDLDTLERRAFRPALELPPWQSMAEDLGRLAVWDPEPLRTAMNQEQTGRRFYEVADVDMDRYGPPGSERPVGVGVREFDAEGLQPDQRTWQNLHFTYPRGIGAIASPLDENTPDGAPIYWLRDIEPVVRIPTAPPPLFMDEPSIHFGETMTNYVIVQDTVAPDAESAAVTSGIPVGSFRRTLAFAWRFGDRNLLFSGEVTDRSRLLFRRRLLDRVARLLPLVLWDDDALPVLVDGRVVWVLDGYTATASFPLAERFALGSVGVRYVRNSVKATVDAVSGAVRFYALDEEEPLLRTYRRVFPGLVEPTAALPEQLRAHLRYPAALFSTQAHVLSVYHVETADVFYAGQDAWQLPGEAAQRTPVTFNYVITRLPGEPDPGFLLVQPLVARQRQIMTALLVAGNDAENYGPRVLFQLPTGQQVPGPAQVEALINQDPTISANLTLWRAAGSTVELGRLRVLPLDSTLLYVQPLFLSSTTSAIPQLQQILVSDGRGVAMAPTLGEAVRAVRRGAGAEPDGGEPSGLAPVEGGALPARALELLDEADRSLRAGDWAGFGRAWEELRQLLRGAAAGAPRR